MSCPVKNAQFVRFLESEAAAAGNRDTAHDLSHVRRVVRNASRLLEKEGAEAFVVIPAAWLHDCVAVRKSSDQRAMASRLAADAAISFLRSVDYPDRFLEEIYHAIEAHSFSAGIVPRTLEAMVVQDADRLDAIGAVGIARCFALGGALGRPLYNEGDPFCITRPPDDSRWTVDHFFEKLLTLSDTMNTGAGRRESRRRIAFMREFLEQLARDIT
jgi:uncharacterized protein